jgi:2-oxo-hept-3-ene-1,7-dioate hydratase
VLDDAVIPHLAAELEAAEQGRTPIGQFSSRFPDMTVEDGYRVSKAWVDTKIANGAKVYGRKIGLTSRAMQRAAQIDEPDYGTLLDYMTYPQASDIPRDRFIDPKVEAEIAFVLKTPLRGPNITMFDVLAATEYVAPAIEIIDARIVRVDPGNGRMRRVQDTIADNAASAAVIVGGSPMKPDAVDMRRTGVLLSRNGVIEETGLAAGVLNHPANGIAWLANKIAPWDERLEPGEVLLSGSFTRPVDSADGDTFCADYGSLGLVLFRFADTSGRES